MKLFKQEDFARFYNESLTAGYSNSHLANIVTKIANDKFREWLSQQKKVQTYYGTPLCAHIVMHQDAEWGHALIIPLEDEKNG